MEHLCTCDDCHPEPFAGHCRYQVEVGELRNYIERALASMRTGPAKHGYAFAVLTLALKDSGKP